MPERVKGIDVAARLIVGAPRRGFRDKPGDRPDGVSADAWEDAQTLAERVWVDLVEGIDFQRLLVEAHARHVTLHPGKGELNCASGVGDAVGGMAVIEGVCGACLTEVLLALDTRPSWDVQPESPRHLRWQDPSVTTLVPPPSLALTADADDDGSRDGGDVAGGA